MKKTTNHLTTFVAGIGLIAVPAAFGQFDTIGFFGDAATDGAAQGGPTWTPPATEAGAFSITAGGADFWGNSDQAAIASASGGQYSTTGDFTASITIDNITGGTANNGWGRSGLTVRATEGTGVPAANDPHFMAIARSNNVFTSGWRDVRGQGTGRASDGVGITDLETTAFTMSVGRSGDTMYGAYQLPSGRWISPLGSVRTDMAALAGGQEATVAFGHQAHNLDAPLSGNDANTVNASGFAYQTSFDASKFGLDWGVTASVSAGPGNELTGQAFIQDGGVKSTDSVDWTITATKRSGVFNPGLQADIYMSGNPGSQAGARGRFGAPDGTAIIPNVNWTGGNDNDNNYNGLTGPASFGVAVQGQDPADSTAGAFSGNQENYGVHMRGEIFIPDDATRGGVESVSFKDGIDDYTYLGIDGSQLIDDNAWTGYTGEQNNGSPIVTLDVSDAKFDDGEWVSFEMIMWEGGGGDNGVLYWDVANGEFPGANNVAAGEGAVVPAANFRYEETETSIFTGSGVVDGSFGVTLPAGRYDLSVSVLGDGRSGTGSGTIIPEPGTMALVALSGLALMFRRRK